MKNRPLQFISTLIISLSGLWPYLMPTGLAYATDADANDVLLIAASEGLELPSGREIDGRLYWTIPELIESSAMVDAKLSEVCGGDTWCKEELHYEQMERYGGIFRALELFDHMHLMLTSINPEEGTMKLLYRDEDKMLSRMLGEPYRQDIRSIYSVWVDQSIADPIRNSSWLAYGERYPSHLGESAREATHIIIDESETELGAGWFTPNVEREYQIQESNIAENSRNKIYFSFVSSDGGVSHGGLDYGSCMMSDLYTPGMECRLLFDEFSYSTMMPVAAITSTTETMSEPEPEPEPNNSMSTETIEPSVPTGPEPATEEPLAGVDGHLATQTDTNLDSAIAESVLTLEIAAISPSQEMTTTQPSIIPKTPETGDPTAPEENHTAPESKWWLVAGILAGIFIMSVWFLLKVFRFQRETEQNLQNLQKKY